MRHRRDLNQKSVKAAFEAMGCAVLDLSQTGNGAPDLLVCSNHDRIPRLVEVKLNKGKIRQSQVEFARRWPGLVYVCRSEAGAAALVELWRGGEGEVEVIEPDQFRKEGVI